MKIFTRITVVNLMGYKIEIHEATTTLSMGANPEYVVGMRKAITGVTGSLLVTPASIAKVLDAEPNVVSYIIQGPDGNGCAASDGGLAW